MNAQRTIEFCFDFGSPTTYLAHTQLPRIASETGARVDYVPMLLGGVFKATGNQSPVMVPAKGRWMGGDLQRFARRYGVPFRFNPHFPINTLTLMRGAVGLQMKQPDRFMPYVTGGAAFGDLKASTPGSGSISSDQTGWTVGAGIEYALSNKWTIKLDYLHVDFGNINWPAVRVHFDEDTVRAGINYKFNWSGANGPP